MKWYFAVGSSLDIDLLLEERVGSILCSFAHFQKGLPGNLIKASNRGLNLMVDSGAFSNAYSNKGVKVEPYLEFLKEYAGPIDEYVVMDDLRKREVTLRNFERMRKQGAKPLLVDHIWFKWSSALEPHYKNEDKLCWGGLISGSRSARGDWAGSNPSKKIGQRVRQRYAFAKADPLTRVHLLGIGQRVRRFMPWFDLVDSFDSATWCRAPGQYGKWCLYYPATKDRPYPLFRQISPESYSGVRPPKEVFEQADRYGFNLHKYGDRIRMAVRELKKYYRALEVFYNQEKHKGVEHLEQIAVFKDDPLPENARPPLIQVQWSAGLSRKMESEALASKKEDRVEPGRFFYQPKPTRPAKAEQQQTIDSLISLYEERAGEWLPAYVQKKYDGARHQVHKNGDNVVVYSEDGEDNTERMPAVVKEVLALKPDKLVADVEIEAWNGRQHLPREVVAGNLHGKGEPDDSQLVVNVFEVLYIEKDIHGRPLQERLSELKSLGIKQSTMGVPDTDQKLNAAPGQFVRTVAELERATRKIRELPGSEGIVAKQSASLYPLDLVTEDTWVKFHNAVLIHGVVTGREKTKGGAWVYQYGVLPGRKPSVSTLEVEGIRVVPVGDTFSTARDFSPGDGILIEGETVNLEETPDGTRLSVWVPRVLGSWGGKPDSVDAVTRRARAQLVLQEKEISESGEVKYLPTRKIEKQADPYLELPDEDSEYRFTVQHHFRGKSFHCDLRIGFRPGKLLIGWTLNTQIADAVKEPVLTLAQARALTKRMDEISKINWNTGEWAKRPKEGTPKLVRTSILCERKAPEPWAWMDVEGKTKEPEEGVPPVGGTRHYPGVFHIVDKGSVEFGAQKPWFHEYFFRGRGLSGRVIFRQLRLGKEIEAEKTILPPSESEAGPLDQRSWLAILPDDLTPYILDKDAVSKGWIAPVGHSALPKAIRIQVPNEYRFWKAKSLQVAKKIRDSLAVAIKSGDVTLDFEAPYKRRTTKESMLDARFVLQEQTWRGPIQIRVGPSRTRWFIRLDIGRPELLVLQFTGNPLDNDRLAAEVEANPHKDSMDLSGVIKPGHYLNPTKDTPSRIDRLDSGKASVINYTKDFLKIRFSGKYLKGLYQAQKNPDTEEWLFEPSKAGPETEKMKAEGFVPIIKAEKRLVTGIVLEPDTIDAQNDTIDAETIEKAAHDFLSQYNRETELGLLHRMFGSIGVKLAESWVAPVDLKIGNVQIKKGTWIMTVKVTADSVWKKIKAGEITGFSIGGLATVVPAVA